MKIVRIGTFSENGMPKEWHFDLEFDGNAVTTTTDKGYCLSVPEDGRVLVNGIEIVEWTEARRKAMSQPIKTKESEQGLPKSP